MEWLAYILLFVPIFIGVFFFTILFAPRVASLFVSGVFCYLGYRYAIFLVKNWKWEWEYLGDSIIFLLLWAACVGWLVQTILSILESDKKELEEKPREEDEEKSDKKN